MEPCYKTFVSVGNGKQYFSRLLNVIEENIDLLPKPILIQRGHTPFRSSECRVTDFVSMDNFIRHVNDAEILILHAGAGSVMHAIKSGKRPIVMPRVAKHDEVVNDHQVSLAKMLHADKKVIMVENSHDLIQAIQYLSTEKNSCAVQKNPSDAFEVIKKKLVQLLGA